MLDRVALYNLEKLGALNVRIIQQKALSPLEFPHWHMTNLRNYINMTTIKC